MDNRSNKWLIGVRVKEKLETVNMDRGDYFEEIWIFIDSARTDLILQKFSWNRRKRVCGLRSSRRQCDGTLNIRPKISPEETWSFTCGWNCVDS